MRRAFALASAALLLCGCRDDMYDQPRYEPLQAGSSLIGRTSALPLPEGTISRQEPRALGVMETGMRDGKLTDTLPMPLDRRLLDRGRERYNIFCSPCHGTIGDGRGMIVLRGLSPPPTFHGDELRDAPIGHFFDVITNGHGAMYSYSARIDVPDRWAIAAYIRALQLSQNAPAASLAPADRAALEGTKP